MTFGRAHLVAHGGGRENTYTVNGMVLASLSPGRLAKMSSALLFSLINSV